MKRFMIITIILLTGCTYSQITIDRVAIARIKTVAIAPFTSPLKLDPKILSSSEEQFRKAFAGSGFVVIDLEKTGDIPSGDTLTIDKITEDARRSGADALLTGEITIHETKTRIVHNHGLILIWEPGFNREHDKTEWKTYLRFRINIKLINTSDGSVILTMTNRYVETEQDEHLPGYLDIGPYRTHVIKKITEELMEEMNSKRKS